MEKKKVSRRDFLKFASLAAGSTALAACATATPEPKPTPVPEVVETEEVVEGPPPLRTATLQFAYYAAEGFDDALYGELLKKWQAGLKEMASSLDFEPIQVNYQKQAMAMAAGNAADVANINVPSAWPLIYRGQLANLQEAINEDADWKSDMSHFLAPPIEAYTYKGGLYAIPNSVETTGTIYNEDLLTEAGVKLPHEYSAEEWDWNALAETAKAVTHGEDQDKVWGLQMSAEWQSGLGDLAASNGGNLLSDDGLESAVTTPEFVEAAQACVDFVLKHEASPSEGALSTAQLNRYSAFINQKIAFMVSGDWAFGWIRNNQLPDMPFKLNFFTSPVSPNTKDVKGIGHATAFYVWQNSEYLPEALAFAKYLSSKSAQEAISVNWTNSPILSPREDAQDPFWSLDIVPNPDAMKQAFAAAIPYPHTPLMSASIAIGHVNTALTLKMDGEDDRSVEEILTEANDKINADLAKGAIGG
jgi:ABC-type glycerol-3-phosphate transport system substrate-binding protein